MPRSTRVRVVIALLFVVVVGCGDNGSTSSPGPGDDVSGDDVTGDASSNDADQAETGDPCEGVPLCTLEQATCAGDTLVDCAENEDGCLIEVQTSCPTSGLVCNQTATTAACVEDPCAGVASPCEAEGRTCDDETLVVCAKDTDGCLEETHTVCTETPGGVCEETADPVICAAWPDPCDGVANACVTAGSACDGNTRVVCAADAFGCLVETRTDCTTRAGGTCTDSDPPRCVYTGSPCEGIETCIAGTLPYCDGDELVVCAADGYGCLVETRTDCADTNNGFCNDSTATALCDVTAIDFCATVTECDPVARECETNVLHVCAPDSFGCVVETTTDCTVTDQICDGTGTARCTDPL